MHRILRTMLVPSPCLSQHSQSAPCSAYHRDAMLDIYNTPYGADRLPMQKQTLTSTAHFRTSCVSAADDYLDYDDFSVDGERIGSPSNVLQLLWRANSFIMQGENKLNLCKNAKSQYKMPWSSRVEKVRIVMV